MTTEPIGGRYYARHRSAVSGEFIESLKLEGVSAGTIHAIERDNAKRPSIGSDLMIITVAEARQLLGLNPSAALSSVRLVSHRRSWFSRVLRRLAKGVPPTRP